LNAHFQKTKVRFQKAAFFPVGGSGILIQVLPDLATSFANSCNKFRKFLQQVPIHALTIPVEVVPARTPAHALKELVLFEKHKFH
jgi:hypothetical protein